MTKMTYTTALNLALNLIADAQAVDPSECADGYLAELDEAKERLTALKASIEKKNSAERKPTATQKENENHKAEILEGMEEGKAYTITELMKAVPSIAELTNQRVSAVVRQMVTDGQLLRTEDKRKAYFTKA